MMNKYTYLLILSFLFMSYSANSQKKLYEINKNMEIFMEVYRTLNEDFVDDLDPSHLMKIGIDAMTKSLDPYTRYISESQVESYRMSIEGKYEGIGAATKKIGEYITIVDTYEGSPAMKAGLKIGDQIIAINGQDTKGKSREDSKKIMRGVKGSTIKFKIKQYDGSQKEVTVKRADVKIPNVPYSGMVSDNVGYVILTTFTANAAKNVSKAIKKLKRKNPNMNKLILDLRGNGGGLLREAIALVNVFVPKGINTVSTKGKVIDRDKSFKTRSEPLDTLIPLVVLIDDHSASASEIVSGSIQDLDRGVLMGQRSFGKGLVQNHKDLSYNSRLKLTTSKYYIPSGRCIQGVEYEDGKPKDIPDDQRNVFYTKNRRKVLDGGGVTPDIKLEALEEDPFVKELISQNVIFNFVNEYTSSMKQIDSVKAYSFSDFASFKSFFNKANFEFKTKAEEILDSLKVELKGGFSSEINSISQTIADNKKTALDHNKKRILQLIEVEIIKRYYFQSGTAEVKLRGDKEIQAAIELLNDSTKYNNILK